MRIFSNIRLILGEYNTTKDEGNEQNFTGKNIFRHENPDVDIAIIQLKGMYNLVYGRFHGIGLHLI